MPPTPTVIANSTIASGYPCTATGNATCPYGFSLSGDLIATLVTGDNVLAVEVHNYNATSPDITFGASLVYRSTLPPPPPPKLEVSWSGTEVFITWPGIGFVLQEAPTPNGGWLDVPETASTNQVNVNPTETAAFYRLRNP
jgi:hypothetical protein